jgi:hypothetical protein
MTQTLTNRPAGCVCRAAQYERFGHRDYCEEQTVLPQYE